LRETPVIEVAVDADPGISGELRALVFGVQCRCGGGGSVYGGFVNMATYQQYSSCVAQFAACNNIFYVKNGSVVRYTPIGTGGARCYTDERMRPGFSGPANIM
jgi:hypothetical protein